MLPRVAIECRVVAEPELRFSNSGVAVAKLRVVAADRRLNQQSGEWEDGDTLWLDVTCFKKLAENVVESVAKGDLLLVTGKLKTDEWTDKDSGQTRSKVVLLADVVAASLQFRTIPHGERRAAPAAGAPPASSQYRAPAEQAYAGADEPPF